jgi:hypothetical protein
MEDTMKSRVEEQVKNTALKTMEASAGLKDAAGGLDPFDAAFKEMK